MKAKTSIIYENKDEFKKAAAILGIELEIVGESRDGLDYEMTFNDPLELFWMGREYADLLNEKILNQYLTRKF